MISNPRDWFTTQRHGMRTEVNWRATLTPSQLLIDCDPTATPTATNGASIAASDC